MIFNIKSTSQKYDLYMKNMSIQMYNHYDDKRSNNNEGVKYYNNEGHTEYKKMDNNEGIKEDNCDEREKERS